MGWFTFPLCLQLTIAVLLASQQAGAWVDVSPRNTLFGTSIKNGQLPCSPSGNYEYTTFNHTCTSPPCVVTQIHIPSIYPQNGDRFNWEEGRIKVYVDGEESPSIDVTILELAHVGRLAARDNDPNPTDGSPFGHALFGKTAHSGGVYSTFRIPFQSSIRTSIVAPPTCSKQATFWFMIRGVEAFQVTVGDLRLPPTARLQLNRINNKTFAPLELIPISTSPAGTSGCLLSVFMDVMSTDPNFLEGCVRFQDGTDSRPIFLSSGTEDFFLSASYYDEGIFNNINSGLTYSDGNGNRAAYKTFVTDPVIFHGGFNLTWRNMETNDPTQQGCPDTFPPKFADEAPFQPTSVNTADITATTLTWAYVWPTEASKDPQTGGSAVLTFSHEPQTIDILNSLGKANVISREEEAAAVVEVAIGSDKGYAIAKILESYATGALSDRDEDVIEDTIRRVLAG